MEIRLSSALAGQMLAHAAETPDVEVCGLLFGRVGEIIAINPTANVAANPATEFEIDPAALITAHKAARGGGPAVAGFYHSHPNGVGKPSAVDQALAQAGDIWVIVACGKLSAWRMGDPNPIALDLILTG